MKEDIRMWRKGNSKKDKTKNSKEQPDEAGHVECKASAES